MAETWIDALVSAGRLAWAKAHDLAGSTMTLNAQIDEAMALGLPLVRDQAGLVWKAGDERLCAETLAHELALAGHRCPLSCRTLVDSTNTHLMAAAISGHAAPFLLIAECQLAGRGRRERSWRAGYGEAILFSALVDVGRPVREMPGLAIAVGVGLAKALEHGGVEGISLKWPNDMLRDGVKLGGILVEAPGGSAAPGACVVGVGINWLLSLQSRADIGRPVADLSGTQLHAASGRSVVAGRLMAAVLDTAATYREQGLFGFLDDFTRLDSVRDRQVVVVAGEQSREGIARGIDADGSLRIEHDDGERRYQSAEVSLRVP